MDEREEFDQPSLFDHIETGSTAKEVELEEKRRKLKKKVATRQLDTIQSKVAFILSSFPEARNSDVSLQIHYWQVFQPNLLSGDVVSLQALYSPERLTSLTRARATIQNDYKLYLPTSEKVARQRKQLDEEQRKKYKPIDPDVPAVSVYADESGKNQDYLVVGSVWVLVPSEEYRLYKEMRDWKEENNFDHELKFNKISKSNRNRYSEFIDRFVVQEGLFGFKAIAMQSAGIADDQAALADLFYFLLRRGIEHEHSTGRAPLPRKLTFIKDFEEEGYDNRLMALITERIENASEAVLDGELNLEAAYAEQSKGIMGLQIADLIAGCVSRTINEPAPEKGWKDRFAEKTLMHVGMDRGLEIKETFNDRAVILSLQSKTLENPS